MLPRSGFPSALTLASGSDSCAELDTDEREHQSLKSPFKSDGNGRGIIVSVSSLPDEILIHIFANLHEHPHALAAAARTCRAWARLFADNALWRGICDVRDFRPLIATAVRAARPPTVQSSSPLLTPNSVAQILRCRCRRHSGTPGSSVCDGRNGTEAFARGRKRCNVLWRGVSLPPWKAVFKQNVLTLGNWTTGKCTIVPVFPPARRAAPEANNNNNEAFFCLAFSETWAVAVMPDGTPGRLIDVKSGAVHMHLVGHHGIIAAAKIKDMCVVTGGVDATLRVWDIQAQSCTAVLTGHTGEIVTIAFNDKIIASGSEDFSIIIWDRPTGQLLRVMNSHTGAVSALQILDDLVISGSIDHSIRVWSWKTGACLNKINGHRGYVYCLQHHNGQLCSGSSDGLIKLWNLSSSKAVRTLHGHESSVVCLQLDATKIVSGSADYSVKVWNRATGHCLYTMMHHTAAVWSLGFFGHRMMTSSFDTSLVVLDFVEEIREDVE
ncbi:hypothetical protein HDU83_009888 [Entophlyctis luteolus]|nr:hypothetical protein HDU82_005467 [Entophlyctis luteolus]KAJ3350107.1 hypothetical protein HDU83_009888 [Entophlyctis luteolus]